MPRIDLNKTITTEVDIDIADIYVDIDNLIRLFSVKDVLDLLECLEDDIRFRDIVQNYKHPVFETSDDQTKGDLFMEHYEKFTLAQFEQFLKQFGV